MPGLLVAAVAILVRVLEKLAAFLLRVRLCPFRASLDVAQLFLEVPDDCSVVELPLELVCCKFEPPCRDLVAPAEDIFCFCKDN